MDTPYSRCRGLQHAGYFMLNASLRFLCDHWFFPVRRERLVPILSRFIKPTDSVLDVGSSDGRLASELGKATGATFLGVDLLVPETTAIPVTPFDGKHLPFDDNHFDCITLVDVLHHTTDPVSLLQEANRVANGRLVIKDHCWDTRFEWWRLAVGDYIGNAGYGIPLPYNFIHANEWDQLLQAAGLRCHYRQDFLYHRFDPYRHLLITTEKFGS